jgi:hypothetical protein
MTDRETEKVCIYHPVDKNHKSRDCEILHKIDSCSIRQQTAVKWFNFRLYLNERSGDRDGV